MKKLMFAAAVCAAMSGYSLESANIVGYQMIQVGTGYRTFAPTFKDIGAAKQFYLADLIPCMDAQGTMYTTGKPTPCNGTIKVQFLSDSVMGKYGRSYEFWSGKPSGGVNNYRWYKKETGGVYVEIGATEVPIASGTGFAVFNDTKSPTYLRVSGEVDLVSQNIAIAGYTLMGNTTPVDMYLADIRPMLGPTEDYTTGKPNPCNGTIKVQLLEDSVMGKYGRSYEFWAGKPTGGVNNYRWYKKETGGVYVEIGETEVPIPAGTAFAVFNDTKKTSYIQLKKPIQD